MRIERLDREIGLPGRSERYKVCCVTCSDDSHRIVVLLASPSTGEVANLAAAYRLSSPCPGSAKGSTPTEHCVVDTLKNLMFW